MSNSMLIIIYWIVGFSLSMITYFLISRRKSEATQGSEFDSSLLPFPYWQLSHNGDTLSSNCDIPIPADLSQRISVTENGEDRYYSAISSNSNDNTHIFAFPCDEMIALEKTNRRLIETLSKTFAKLPVGLAIFDADNTLSNFNPAVTELLNLDAAWLAGRPSIAEVLENLRENRRLPDHKDFLEWRRLLVELKSTSRSNGYSEIWTLPNGNSLQVTGEAHSEGAVTFLFEDITAQIAVERRHFAETALNQAVIDHILDPMVVINPAGSIISANNAFEELFNFQGTSSVSDSTISGLAIDFPVAEEFWSRLQVFVSQLINRESWSIQINLDAARTADVHPMPDGSTLVFLRLKWVSPHIIERQPIAVSANVG